MLVAPHRAFALPSPLPGGSSLTLLGWFPRGPSPAPRPALFPRPPPEVCLLPPLYSHLILDGSGNISFTCSLCISPVDSRPHGMGCVCVVAVICLLWAVCSARSWEEVTQPGPLPTGKGPGPSGGGRWRLAGVSKEEKGAYERGRRTPGPAWGDGGQDRDAERQQRVCREGDVRSACRGSNFALAPSSL